MRDLVKRVGRPARDALVGLAALRSADGRRPGIHVSYGARVPSSNSAALTGGFVKLGALQQHFPATSSGFNLLYLVSSRLPGGAVQMATFAQRKGARFVLNQDGVAYPAWYGPRWREVNGPLARLVHRADYVFFQSEFCRQAADLFLGPRLGPGQVLHNAVDTRTFVPAPFEAEPRRFTVLLAGTHRHAYRVETALLALARIRTTLPSAQLMLAGRLAWHSDEREARSHTERIAAQLGVLEHVCFVGPYRQSAAPAVYQRGHVLLHTQYNDACPTVVLEGMACGLPVVFSASGGTPELVGDAGIGVPAVQSWHQEQPPNPDALAEAVFQVFVDRARLAALARQRAVERFDLRRWLATHQKVFEQVLA